MEERPVADVLEHVIVAHERRHADPGRAFAAHLRQERKAAAGIGQAHRHGVAADAAAGDLAFQQEASSGCAGSRNRIRRRGSTRVCSRGLRRCFDESGRGRRRVRSCGAALARRLARGRFCRDRVRRTAGRAARLAILLPKIAGRAELAIESVAQLHFEEAALLLDHQDRFEALGELARKFRIERERHAELGDADADSSNSLSPMPRSRSACTRS